MKRWLVGDDAMARSGNILDVRGPVRHLVPGFRSKVRSTSPGGISVQLPPQGFCAAKLKRIRQAFYSDGTKRCAGRSVGSVLSRYCPAAVPDKSICALPCWAAGMTSVGQQRSANGRRERIGQSERRASPQPCVVRRNAKRSGCSGCRQRCSGSVDAVLRGERF